MSHRSLRAALVLAAAAALVLDAGAAHAQAAPATAPAATPGQLAAAESLLVATKMESMIVQMGDQAMQAQLRANPQLAPYSDVMKQFFNEQMSWPVLRPEYLRLYTETFTESELRQMTAFYRTPLGQKMLEKTPEIMGKAMELSQRRMQAAMPQLIERIQARATELEGKGSAGTPPKP